MTKKITIVQDWQKDDNWFSDERTGYAGCQLTYCTGWPLSGPLTRTPDDDTDPTALQTLSVTVDVAVRTAGSRPPTVVDDDDGARFVTCHKVGGHLQVVHIGGVWGGGGGGGDASRTTLCGERSIRRRTNLPRYYFIWLTRRPIHLRRQLPNVLYRKLGYTGAIWNGREPRAQLIRRNSRPRRTAKIYKRII